MSTEVSKLNQQAQAALSSLKQTIFDYISLNPKGVTSTDIVKSLDLYSDFEGKQKNYLSWSVVGILVNEGKIHYETRSNRKYYSVK